MDCSCGRRYFIESNNWKLALAFLDLKLSHILVWLYVFICILMHTHSSEMLLDKHLIWLTNGDGWPNEQTEVMNLVCSFFRVHCMYTIWKCRIIYYTINHHNGRKKNNEKLSSLQHHRLIANECCRPYKIVFKCLDFLFSFYLIHCDH